MKNKISTIIVIIAALFSTNMLNAQQGRQQGPPPLPSDEQIEEMVTDLAKELTLSDEQTVLVSDLYFEHFDQAAELQENNSGREEMENLRKDLDSDVKEVLSDEQQELYDDYLKDQRSKGRNQGRQKGGRK